MSHEMTASDLSRLADALYAVLALVAGADGNVDPKERKRFAQMLLAAKATPDATLRRVIEDACARPEGQQSVSDPEATLAEAVRAAEALLTGEELIRYKQGLFMIGEQLAEASGGVLGLGERKSATELRALRRLGALLGFESA